MAVINKFHAGDLVKCARMNLKVSQIDLAKIINCSQSFISKIENGSLVPDAFQWMVLSDFLKFPADSLRYGYLDKGILIKPRDDKRESGFALPKEYQKGRAANLKFIAPLIETLEEVKGENYYRDFLKNQSIDPAFGVNFSHQINYNFFEKTLSETSSSLPSDQELGILCANKFAQERSHGIFWQSYKKQKSSLKSIEIYIRNMKSYQSFWNFEFENITKSKAKIKIKPSNILEEVSTKTNDFLNEYWPLSLQSFNSISAHSAKEETINVIPSHLPTLGDQSWHYNIMVS